MRLGRKRHGGEPPADVYTGLREQIFALTPDQLGAASAGAPILALVLETGYDEAVATLVGVVDGTTSLYFSNGGGIGGRLTLTSPAGAGTRLLAEIPLAEA